MTRDKDLGRPTVDYSNEGPRVFTLPEGLPPEEDSTTNLDDTGDFPAIEIPPEVPPTETAHLRKVLGINDPLEICVYEAPQNYRAIKFTVPNAHVDTFLESVSLINTANGSPQMIPLNANVDFRGAKGAENREFEYLITHETVITSLHQKFSTGYITPAISQSSPQLIHTPSGFITVNSVAYSRNSITYPNTNQLAIAQTPEGKPRALQTRRPEGLQRFPKVDTRNLSNLNGPEQLKTMEGPCTYLLVNPDQILAHPDGARLIAAHIDSFLRIGGFVCNHEGQLLFVSTGNERDQIQVLKFAQSIAYHFAEKGKEEQHLKSSPVKIIAGTGRIKRNNGRSFNIEGLLHGEELTNKIEMTDKLEYGIYLTPELKTLVEQDNRSLGKIETVPRVGKKLNRLTKLEVSGLKSIEVPDEYIGYRAERATLQNAIESNQTRLVVLKGEPGRGKSRLMRQVILDMPDIEFAYTISDQTISNSPGANLGVIAAQLIPKVPDIRKLRAQYQQFASNQTGKTHELGPMLRFSLGSPEHSELGNFLAAILHDKLKHAYRASDRDNEAVEETLQAIRKHEGSLRGIVHKHFDQIVKLLGADGPITQKEILSKFDAYIKARGIYEEDLADFDALPALSQQEYASQNPANITLLGNIIEKSIEARAAMTGDAIIPIIDDVQFHDQDTEGELSDVTELLARKGTKIIQLMREKEIYEPKRQGELRAQILTDAGNNPRAIATISLEKGLPFNRDAALRDRYITGCLPADFREAVRRGELEMNPSWTEYLGKLAGNSPFDLVNFVQTIGEQVGGFYIENGFIHVSRPALEAIRNNKKAEELCAVRLGGLKERSPLAFKAFLVLALSGDQTSLADFTATAVRVIPGVGNANFDTRVLEPLTSRAGYAKADYTSIGFDYQLMREFVLNNAEGEEIVELAQKMLMHPPAPDKALVLFNAIAKNYGGDPEKLVDNFWKRYYEAARSTLGSLAAINNVQAAYDQASEISELVGTIGPREAYNYDISDKERLATLSLTVRAQNAAILGKNEEAGEMIAELQRINRENPHFPEHELSELASLQNPTYLSRKGNGGNHVWRQYAVPEARQTVEDWFRTEHRQWYDEASTAQITDQVVAHLDDNERFSDLKRELEAKYMQPATVAELLYKELQQGLLVSQQDLARVQLDYNFFIGKKSEGIAGMEQTLNETPGVLLSPAEKIYQNMRLAYRQGKYPLVFQLFEQSQDTGGIFAAEAANAASISIDTRSRIGKEGGPHRPDPMYLEAKRLALRARYEQFKNTIKHQIYRVDAQGSKTRANIPAQHMQASLQTIARGQAPSGYLTKIEAELALSPQSAGTDLYDILSNPIGAKTQYAVASGIIYKADGTGGWKIATINKKHLEAARASLETGTVPAGYLETHFAFTPEAAGEDLHQIFSNPAAAKAAYTYRKSDSNSTYASLSPGYSDLTSEQKAHYRKEFEAQLKEIQRLQGILDNCGVKLEPHSQLSLLEHKGIVQAFLGRNESAIKTYQELWRQSDKMGTHAVAERAAKMLGDQLRATFREDISLVRFIAAMKINVGKPQTPQPSVREQRASFIKLAEQLTTEQKKNKPRIKAGEVAPNQVASVNAQKLSYQMQAVQREIALNDPDIRIPSALDRLQRSETIGGRTANTPAIHAAIARGEDPETLEREDHVTASIIKAVEEAYGFQGAISLGHTENTTPQYTVRGEMVIAISMAFEAVQEGLIQMEEQRILDWFKRAMTAFTDMDKTDFFQRAKASGRTIPELAYIGIPAWIKIINFYHHIQKSNEFSPELKTAIQQLDWNATNQTEFGANPAAYAAQAMQYGEAKIIEDPEYKQRMAALAPWAQHHAQQAQA